MLLSDYVGRKLKERRTAKKITQTELGNALGLTCQQIQKYENGTNKINIDTLHRIAKILDVDIGYFFAGFYDNNEVKDITAQSEQAKEEATVLKYFRKIDDEKVRKKILELIKALAAE